LSIAEFQYNVKKHAAIRYTSFKLNFGRHSWKGNLTIRMELPKLDNFLGGIQRSWNKAKILINMAKEAMKKQFNKKRRKPQGLKVGNNMWLEAKNIQLKRLSKKLDQKRYGPFTISKDIGQEVFQLKLLEELMIHNMFNEDLLIQCREPHFKRQHIDPMPLPEIINEKE